MVVPDASGSLAAGDDGARHRLAHLTKHVFRRHAELAEGRGAAEEALRRFLVEHARIDRSMIDLTEREQRCERNASIAAAERTVLQKREEERRHFLREGRIGLAAERRHLRPLHRLHESELRFDDTGMCLMTAKLRADGLVQVDEILNSEITRTALSL